MPARPPAPLPRDAEQRRPGMVTARDLMRTPMITINRHAPLAEAARLLIGNGISGAPVTDARDRIVGVVSLRDLVERYAELFDAPRHERAPEAATAEPKPDEEQDLETDEAELEDDLAERATDVAEEDLVEDVMTSEIRSVPASASLPEIAQEMKRHSVHRLLVEEDGRYVGILGTLEVLDVLFP